MKPHLCWETNNGSLRNIIFVHKDNQGLPFLFVKVWRRNFNPNLFNSIANCWKQSKCSSVNEWIKTLWYIYTMEYHVAERKAEPTLCNSMDGSGEHYAKGNKPGHERQIPHDFTYKLNLINKTNKQTKYN